jgi:hypothetical protein
MNTGKPLVNKKYSLEKFPGKGGWTYAQIPEIPPDKEAPFGWVRVRGSIDGFEIKNCLLMPMGNGKLFLPVKADIRKKIKKAAGDQVKIILYKDDLATEIPEELQSCLEDEPGALKKFQGYSDAEQRAFINWIYSAKTVETKIQRIAKTIDKVLKGQKLLEKKAAC